MAIGSLAEYVAFKDNSHAIPRGFRVPTSIDLKHGQGGRKFYEAGGSDFLVGLKSLDNMFARLPAKIQTAILRRAMQQGLKPFYQEARRLVPVQWQRYEIWNENGGFMSDVFNQITRRRTGRLKKSISRRTKSNKFKQEYSGNLFVKHKKHRVYYSHLTEWGTQAHFINNYFGQRGHKKWVKGQKAQKWMTRAWNKKWRTSLSRFKKVLKQEVKKQFRIYLMQLSAEERMAMVRGTIRTSL